MPRQARLDAPGTLHHVILREIEKRQIGNDDWDRENFVTRLGALASETETRIPAWALLTNHAHILSAAVLMGFLPACDDFSGLCYLIQSAPWPAWASFSKPV